MAVTYMEGGVGAVAYNHVVGKRAKRPGLIIAASSGSALLLAQGKFGEYDENAVRWLGALGADYGVIIGECRLALQDAEGAGGRATRRTRRPSRWPAAAPSARRTG